MIGIIQKLLVGILQIGFQQYGNFHRLREEVQCAFNAGEALLWVNMVENWNYQPGFNESMSFRNLKICPLV
jgi:hypothetical protein